MSAYRNRGFGILEFVMVLLSVFAVFVAYTGYTNDRIAKVERRWKNADHLARQEMEARWDALEVASNQGGQRMVVAWIRNRVENKDCGGVRQIPTNDTTDAQMLEMMLENRQETEKACLRVEIGALMAANDTTSPALPMMLALLEPVAPSTAEAVREIR